MWYYNGMRKDIEKWIRKIAEKYGMNAKYLSDDDVYVIHKRGFAIQNFTTKMFYDVPKRVREKQLLALMKRGLTHNLGENSLKDNLIVRTSYGRNIA